MPNPPYGPDNPEPYRPFRTAGITAEILHMQLDDKKKQASLDVAEDSRQEEWEAPSFVADLFKGDFRWDLIHPFPVQSAEDKAIGDAYIAKLKPILEQYIDSSEVDRTRELPKEAIKALQEAGAFGMKIAKEYGGLGLSQVNYSRICAYVGSYCASTGAWLTAHQSIGVAGPLKYFGTKEQKDHYLPRIAKGAISAFGLTEPGVGSDPANMQTFAQPSEDGSHYIVNGEKLWITNGPVAEIMILLARTPDIEVRGKKKKQITAFVFETDTPGYEVVHRCDFMGIRGIQNGLLRFNNCKIPAANVIGKPGDGLKIALITLVNGRLSIPATSGAGGKKALSASSKWVKQREQWGAPIGKHQNTAIKVARLASNTFASEAITWLCCAFADEGHVDIRIEAAMAKYFCTEASCAMADDFVQIRGGRGYETAESLAMRGEDPIPAERFLRDARISRIVEGTSEIMRLYIAREAMDTHVRQIIPMMTPGVNKVQHFFKSFLPFYAAWYPKQWLPAAGGYKVNYLDARNQAHLSYIGKAAKRLARTMFHTMAKYQQKLEREQIILANFVDIGTELFAMAASLSYAESLLAHNADKESLQDLVDLFCTEARKRVEENFKAVGKNFNGKYTRIANHAMDGKYGWFCTGVYDETPPGYKKYMNQSIDAYEARMAAQKDVDASLHEPVAK
jgi:alkylation response protein AidB-like acyl-CoA dehydrogenase